MKNHPPRLRAAFKTIICLVSAVVLFWTGQGLSDTRSQDADNSRLTLVMRDNGFDGLFLTDGKTYRIENWVSKDMFRTRILRPDGSILIETAKESEVALISLPTGKLQVDVAKRSAFSAEERSGIQQFIQSSECALVKKIVIAVFKQRAAEKPSLLGGFPVISMFLGE